MYNKNLHNNNITYTNYIILTSKNHYDNLLLQSSYMTMCSFTIIYIILYIGGRNLWLIHYKNMFGKFD